MKGKGYKPFGGNNKKADIARAAGKSGTRTEEYVFKSRYGGDSTLDAFISQEMISLANDHSSRLKSLEGSKWEDRTNSLLAQPLSAEDMFLSKDNGNPIYRFQGTRFFHEELTEMREDSVGNLITPSVNRFAYSDDANAASAILANKLAKNLSRRHYAAAMLQRNYRIMISLRNFRKEVVEAHTASKKIQCFWKKRLERIRKRRLQKDFERVKVVRIQAQMRRYLAVQGVCRKRYRILHYMAKVVTRFIRFSGKELKRKRGRVTRGYVHATRIQAFARGVAIRQRVRRMKTSVDLIWKTWRVYWMRRKGVHGKRLMRALRRTVLVKKILICQRILRVFLAQRRFAKKRLELLAYERKRIHSEQVTVGKDIAKAVASHDFSWVETNGGGNPTQQSIPNKTAASSQGGDKKITGGPKSSRDEPLSLPDLKFSGNEVRGTDVVDFMELLDLMCNSIIYDGSAVKSLKRVDRRILNIDPELSISTMPLRRRIALAVLAAFCSHPGGMIHWTALRECKSFLNAVQVKPDNPDHARKGLQGNCKYYEDDINCEKDRPCTGIRRESEPERELSIDGGKLPGVPPLNNFMRSNDRVTIVPPINPLIEATDVNNNGLPEGKNEYEPYRPRDIEEVREAAEKKCERDLIKESKAISQDMYSEARLEKETHLGEAEMKSANKEVPASPENMRKGESISRLDAYARHSCHIEVASGASAEEVWDRLEAAGPLISIIEASRWLEPSLALRCRVTIQGHLPDKVLALAVIVRRWTHWVENTIRRSLWKSRLTMPVPKQSCPFCLESLLTPEAERAHYPCQNNQWTAYFVPKSLYQPAIIALQNRIKNLAAFPSINRSNAEKDRQHILYKLKARNDEAYRAFKVMGPSDLDKEWESRQAQINVEKFIEFMKSAVQLTKDEDGADEIAQALASPSKTKTVPSIYTPSMKKQSNPQTGSPGFEDIPPPGKQSRTPPPSPAAPEGIEYIPFVEEFVPKARDLFIQWDHEETHRLIALEPGVDSPDNKKPISPFSTPTKKGSVLVFTKASNIVGEGYGGGVKKGSKKSSKKSSKKADKGLSSK